MCNACVFVCVCVYVCVCVCVCVCDMHCHTHTGISTASCIRRLSELSNDISKGFGSHAVLVPERAVAKGNVMWRLAGSVAYNEMYCLSLWQQIVDSLSLDPSIITLLTLETILPSGPEDMRNMNPINNQLTPCGSESMLRH